MKRLLWVISTTLGLGFGLVLLLWALQVFTLQQGVKDYLGSTVGNGKVIVEPRFNLLRQSVIIKHYERDIVLGKQRVVQSFQQPILVQARWFQPHQLTVSLPKLTINQKLIRSGETPQIDQLWLREGQLDLDLRAQRWRIKIGPVLFSNGWRANGLKGRYQAITTRAGDTLDVSLDIEEIQADPTAIPSSLRLLTHFERLPKRLVLDINTPIEQLLPAIARDLAAQNTQFYLTQLAWEQQELPKLRVSGQLRVDERLNLDGNFVLQAQAMGDMLTYLPADLQALPEWRLIQAVLSSANETALNGTIGDGQLRLNNVVIADVPTLPQLARRLGQ